MFKKKVTDSEFYHKKIRDIVKYGTCFGYTIKDLEKIFKDSGASLKQHKRGKIPFEYGEVVIYKDTEFYVVGMINPIIYVRCKSYSILQTDLRVFHRRQLRLSYESLCKRAEECIRRYSMIEVGSKVKVRNPEELNVSAFNPRDDEGEVLEITEGVYCVVKWDTTQKVNGYHISKLVSVDDIVDEEETEDRLYNRLYEIREEITELMNDIDD